MTLKAIFRWKNPDSTADLNQRQANLVNRGIIWGGEIQPGVGLTVNVTPSVAHSNDGMTVLEDANTVLNVLAGQVNVVVLKAQYNPGGSPTQPTLTWHVYEESVYNGRPDKDYLINYGKVTLAGAVAVVLDNIDTTERDVIDPMDRNWFRGKVATPAALPLPPPHMNREGDFYYVVSANALYFWDGTAWVAQTSGSFNNEVSSMSQTLVRSERDRIIEGSGLLSGTRPSTDGDYASEPELFLIEDPMLDSQIGIDTFSVLVNGLFSETYAQMIQLDPKADRYDLIFLEVWREAEPNPQNFGYERNPDGSSTYDIDQVREKLFKLLWQNGLAGDNFDLNQIMIDNHDGVVTKWRFGHISGVPKAALYNPSNATVVALSLNIDGNAFSIMGPTGMDQRVWIAAAATTGYDAVSWAIPLLVVRRTVAEDHTVGNGIQEFRGGNRYIFRVNPVCDVANAGRGLLKKNHREEPHPFGMDDYPFDEPSGFLTGMDRPLGPGIAANSWQLFDEPIKVQVRGIKDWVQFPNLAEILNAPPAATYARELVYLKMNITLYTNRFNSTNYKISDKHRPFFPANLTGNVQSMGWKQGFVQWSLIVENLGATTVLDEDDAMAAAGWQRGDVTLSGIGKEYEDGGIYSRSITIDADDRIHPYLAEWAIPVFLAHRRNNQAWAAGDNGTGAGRPDDRQDPTVLSPDDLVDLRHLVGVTEADMGSMLEADVDSLCKGQLRTRMAEPWVGPGAGTHLVAGSRILQSDFIGFSGGNNHQMTVGDDVRKIWSDAKELSLVCASFDLNADYTDPRGLIIYTLATGSLQFIAPTGAHIVRHLPASCMATSDEGSSDYLNYFHQPLFSTQEDFDSTLPIAPTPSSMKVINGNVEVPTPWNTATKRFSVNTYDSLDRMLTTRAPAAIDPTSVNPGDTAVVSFWVHYDRTQVSTSLYALNYGLSEIPDEVHAVTLGPLSGSPEPMHLGTPYVVLRASLLATNNFTFSRTQVKAASGYNTVPDADFEIVGVDLANLTWYPAPLGLTIGNTGVSLTLAKDATTVILSGNYTGDVEAVVFYNIKSPSAPTKWVEVGRGGKSIRASFEWHQEEIDFGVPSPAGLYSFDIGTAHWQHAEVAGRFTEMPLVWSKANPGDPWIALTIDNSGIKFGYPQSNLISMEFPLLPPPTIMRYMLVVFPKHTPLGNGISQHVRIDYTYTPYQGLSKTGGTPFSSIDLPALRDKLHGIVEANTDFFATQGGPCSYYGGVDSWGGTPARIPSNRTALYNGKFSEYNQTQLVKPDNAAMGVLDWSSNKQGKSVLNTAVVLRLPFPANPNMVGFDLSGPIDYHSGTMEWDLDPGNEGASAGFFSYAPAYPSVLTTIDTSLLPNDKVLYHQFVNALTPLALPGEMSEEDRSTFIPASSESGLQLTSGAGYDLTGFEIDNNRWRLPPSSTAIIEANLAIQRGDVVGRTMLAAYQIQSGDISSYGHRLLALTEEGVPDNMVGAQSQILETAWSLYWTAPNSFVGAEDVFICTFPGMPLAFLQLQQSDLGLTLWKKFITGGSAPDRLITSTLCTSARMRGYYLPSDKSRERPRIYEPSYDLIRIPMQSGSTNNGEGYGNSGNGVTSLKGRQINYPSSWSPTTITNMENSIVGSKNFYPTYGRGVYLGNTQFRFNMPVLIPGTGTALDQASELHTPLTSLTIGRILMSDFPDSGAQPPEPFPCEPVAPLFASSPRRNLRHAFGGPLAYTFYGLMISPSSDQYKNRAVMQITGGPVMGNMNDAINYSFTNKLTETADNNPNRVNGTALDAFWPKHRPILKSK